MFGKNTIQKPETGSGEILKVTSIFPTFQGEGPFTGHPAIFIRLSGCNLACDFCDTEFDSFTQLSIDKILQQVNKLNQHKIYKLIVLTGGETFRQPIELLCNTLLQNEFDIQIETNGTLYRNLDERVQIICSPKAPNGKYHRIREDLLPRINAFKFIVSDSKEGYQDIADVGQYDYNIPVYLQPMDEYDEEKNRNNVKLALELAEKYGCRISLQTHKVLGIE